MDCDDSIDFYNFMYFSKITVQGERGPASEGRCDAATLLVAQAPPTLRRCDAPGEPPTLRRLRRCDAATLPANPRRCDASDAATLPAPSDATTPPALRRCDAPGEPPTLRRCDAPGSARRCDASGAATLRRSRLPPTL